MVMGSGPVCVADKQYMFQCLCAVVILRRRNLKFERGIPQELGATFVVDCTRCGRVWRHNLWPREHVVLHIFGRFEHEPLWEG